MQPDLLSPPFDYSVVDGLGRAHRRGMVPRLDGKIFRARAAGPAIELANLEAGIDLQSLGERTWLDRGSLQPLLSALAAKPRQWLAPDGRRGLVMGAGLEQGETSLASRLTRIRPPCWSRPWAS